MSALNRNTYGQSREMNRLAGQDLNDGEVVMSDIEREAFERDQEVEDERGIRGSRNRPAAGPTDQLLDWSHTLLEGDAVTLKEAEKAVAELGAGWCLPTRAELESLLDLSRHDPAIDTEKYPDTQSRYYWTCTPCAWNSAARWVVDFSHGAVLDLLRSHYACVRAVRSGQ